MTRRTLSRITLAGLAIAPPLIYLALTKIPNVIHAQVKVARQADIPAFVAVLSETIQAHGGASVESARITIMKNAAGAWSEESMQIIPPQLSHVTIQRSDGLISKMYPDVRAANHYGACQ